MFMHDLIRVWLLDTDIRCIFVVEAQVSPSETRIQRSIRIRGIRHTEGN